MLFFTVDANARLQVTIVAQDTAVRKHGGFAYNVDGKLHVENAVPAAGSPRIGGISTNNNGTVYVTNVAPDATNSNTASGVLVDDDGRVYVENLGTISHRWASRPLNAAGSIVTVGLV